MNKVYCRFYKSRWCECGDQIGNEYTPHVLEWPEGNKNRTMEN